MKSYKGITKFRDSFPDAKVILVGDSNITIEDFLLGKVPLF